jgi:general secretion pathway protein K
MKAAAVNPSERGVALLLALLLVAVLSAVAVLALDDVKRLERLEVNAEHTQQARWLAEGAFAYAQARRSDLLRVSDDTGAAAFANGPIELSFPIETGGLFVTVRDGQSCFSLNSLVEGAGDIWQVRPSAARQMMALLESQDVAAQDAERLVNATRDWLTGGGGFAARLAGDVPYEVRRPAYGVGAEPFAEVSEWRAVVGVDARTYQRLRPLLCARPKAGVSPININALAATDGSLLVGLSEGGLNETLARRILANRPSSGFASPADLWSDPLLTGLPVPAEAVAETVTRSEHFEVQVRVRHHDTEVFYSGWVMDSAEGLVLTALRWTEPE